jgi:aminoglycoside/choline kinase family phosphotransferase
VKEIVVPQHTVLWCEDVLSRSGETVADLEPLRVEASHRCFYRVQTGKRSVVLMDSPPALERNDLFAAVGQVFLDHDIPIAQILAAEPETGLFLLSDLGDSHFESLYGSGQQDDALRAAIDLLPKLGAIDDPVIEPYSSDRLHAELDIFNEWFMGRLLRLEIYTGMYAQTSEILVTALELQPKCCVHRDYHCRNLLYNDGRLGVVDFQDALHGPVLYDIASLLRDCYYTFPEPEITRWLDYFVGLTPVLQDLSHDQVQQWFDWTAAQRQLKAIGIFARMYFRDGKGTHLRYIQPMLHRLQTLARSYSELRLLDVQLTGCIDAAEPALAKLI